jgi:hypothetical protein
MNLFLVESPLQLLNAIEAKNYFDLDDRESILIVFIGKSELNFEQINYLIDKNSWKEINFIRHNKKVDVIKKVFSLNRIAKRYLVSSVFFGDYRSWYMRHFINITKPENVYLLDDGAATVNIYNQLSIGFKFEEKRLFLKLIKKYLLRIREEDIQFFDYFTIYDLKTTSTSKIFRNNYQVLKSLNKLKEKSNEVFLLGQPISEKNVMEEDKYIDYLIKIQKYYNNYRLIYICHRSETKEKVLRIENELGISCRTFDTSIEYALSLQESLPKVLISFYSSALINCKEIFGDIIDISSYYIDSKDINSDYRTYVENIYRYINKMINIK